MSVWRALRFVVEGFVILLALTVLMNRVLFAFDAPFWAHPLAGGLIGFVVNFGYLRWRMRQHLRNRLVKDVLPEQVWVDTGNPFDPRGDGTLQPGDPLFDNVMEPLRKGLYPDGVVVVSVDGIHEVRTPPKGFRLPPDLND